MADIFNMLDTWAASGTVFTGIKLNVTDTASAAGSLLMDLQMGGVSQFSVTKAGRTNIADLNCFAGDLLVYRNGTAAARFGTGRFSVGTEFGISNNNPNAPDIFLARDAANTLAQRNGVNAQAFNLYNTYTDASNYERGFMRFVSNALEIGAEAAGTGTTRTVILKSGGTVVVQNHLSPNVNTWSLGASTPWNNLFLNSSIQMGGYHQMTEMTAPAAPAANQVRIYAEDDGAGKTRLMARFATGAAVQIAIEP